LRAARSCSHRCAARTRSSSGRGQVGPCSVHSHQLQGMSEMSDLAGATRVKSAEKKQKFHSPAGRGGA
jgi:hypothetical protein